MTLNTKSNFHREGQKVFKPYRPGDDFYEALIDMHRDLNEAQSNRVNARLILLMANHIGDVDVLEEAIRIARKDA
ncbi:MAG: DUF2783 domain-containing protein [Proteobacteria bacterium]|nr:DUF2783 domain-containing protein [Pseudomonadota bacterium]